MSDFLKRILFVCYVFFARRNNKQTVEAVGSTRIFIWKHAYFFFWHLFFWRKGRDIFGMFAELTPLCGDIFSERMHTHYERFCVLNARDRDNRSLHAKILKQTTYRLAPDTVRELCYVYLHVAGIAPWQYGVDARRRACTQLRNYFLFALLLFAISCNFFVSNSTTASGFVLLTFFVTLLALVGWYADRCLYEIACEAEVLRSNPKYPR